MLYLLELVLVMDKSSSVLHYSMLGNCAIDRLFSREELRIGGERGAKTVYEQLLFYMHELSHYLLA